MSRLTLNPGAFRLILASAVMVGHTLPIKFGITAVYLFFALSGYWVYSMWQGEYASTPAPYRIFIISRFWRLMPVYFLALALFLLACIAVHGENVAGTHQILSNVFILGLSRLPLGQRFIQPAWSLDIEMQFYFLAPLMIMLFQRPDGGKLLSAVAAGSVLCSGYFLVHDEGRAASTGYLPMYLIFFLIGMGTARSRWSPSPKVIYASLAAAAAFVAACLVHHSTRALFLQGSFATTISTYNPAASFALAVVLAPYAMATVNVRTARNTGWFAGIDRHLSNVTYEVYLFHGIIFQILDRYLPQGRLKQLPLIFAGYAAVGLLSWGVYVCFDRPTDALRKKFVKDRVRLPSGLVVTAQAKSS